MKFNAGQKYFTVMENAKTGEKHGIKGDPGITAVNSIETSGDGAWVKFNGKIIREGEVYTSNGSHPKFPKGLRIEVTCLDPGSDNAFGLGSGFVGGTYDFWGWPWHFEGFENTKR